MTEMYFRLLIAISIIFVLKDWYKIEVLKKSPDHKRGLLLRGCTCLAIALVLADGSIDRIENLICTPVIMGYIFQYGLNLARKRPLVYLSPRSNKFDYMMMRTFRRPILAFVFMTILFVGAIIWKIA